MGLAAERVLHRCDHWSESGRMSCVLEGMEHSSSFPAGEVELTRAVLRNVNGDDAINLVTVWLHGDWYHVSIAIRNEGLIIHIHGCHFMPASSNV